ncbi:hypothetical protein V2J09_007509 [Rumex salicifolius]
MANAPIVKHISECFIRPKFDVEDAKNPVYLAPSDLAMLSAHYIQKGLLFTKPSPSNESPHPMNDLLDNLKHSLSVALVHFYPLAGRLDTQIDEDQHTSLIFINCNKGPGARLIHAELDMTSSEILEPHDVPRVVQSFFDHDRAVNHDGHTRPLLSVQVTELVDGVFIGCSINHVCVDGTSYWHFFNSWSEIFMANGDNIVISRPPIHKRWFIDGTGPILKLPYTHTDEFISRLVAPKLRERIFHLSPQSLAKLKAKANEECGGNTKISSFQALSALVWRCITRARSFRNDLETRCKLAINNRARFEPPLPNNYFGNSIQTVQGSAKVGELLSHNLGYAALLLHQAVAEHNDRKARGLLEKWIQTPFVYQLASFFDPHSVMMGSSPRFDMYGNEFGMGKALAVLSGYANKFDGKVTSYPGRQGGGSIDLEMCLPPDSMRKLESDEEFMEVVYGDC